MKNFLIASATALAVSTIPAFAEKAPKQHQSHVITKTASEKVGKIVSRGICRYIDSTYNHILNTQQYVDYGTMRYADIQTPYVDENGEISTAIERDVGVNCEDFIQYHSDGTVWVRGKRLKDADAKKFTIISIRNWATFERDVFFTDKKHVWDINFRLRPDVDAKTLRRGSHHSCFGQFIVDKNHVYDGNGKVIPNISPDLQGVGKYTTDVKKSPDANIQVFKDHSGLWKMNAGYTNLNPELQKIPSLKGLTKARMSCD